MKEICYVIANKRSNGHLACYYYFSEIFYGTVEDAKNMLKYVKTNSPGSDWKIYEMTASVIDA
jgi:hypothetical protein